MKISSIFKFSLVAMTIALYGCDKNSKTDNNLGYIDPMIGSGGHGHVFVGANTPHGAVQLGIVNVSQGWDWCSGYHISDTTVTGIAHTHLSGTGIGDKGDIQFMPVTGNVSLSKGDYLSTFKRANEITEPGYYATILDKYGINVELTASDRLGFHRYTYPNNETPVLLVDLTSGIGWDKLSDAYISKSNDYSIEGYRLSKGWADDDRVFFYAKFNKKIESFDIVSESDSTGGKSKYIAILKFGEDNPNILEAAVAISSVDIEGAKVNFESENNTFDNIRSEASKKWNDLISTIEVEGGTDAQKRTFYTALYHANFFPSLFSDVDGRYRGADGNIYSSKSDIYTIFSLWDTYRAAHPLYTVTDPKRVVDYINTFISIYEQQGKLPVWHLAGNETDCMVGFGSVQVIADAMLKGIKGFDYNKAYKAMVDYASLNERGLKQLREEGYIASDKELESVAKSLEYAISDAAIAQVAKMMNKEDDYKYFHERSQVYKKYFDSNDNFIKGLLSDGSRRYPFDPAHSSHREDDFCEGNSWQYTWMVPHDFEGLFSLFGSNEKAEAKLDSLFSTPFIVSEGTSPDISGMIGQYAHGNEPSHSTIYAYEALGKQDKTAELARFIMDSLYTDAPDGLSGNEDCGQMSAWYVLNAIGLYQPNPSGGVFVFGSPIFDKVTLNLQNGNKFVIIAENDPSKNIYIKEAFLNGVKLDKTYINYSDIMKGGELRFVMDSK